MARERVRAVEAYSIHGHIDPGSEDEGVLDYVSFFDSLLRAEGRLLQKEISGDTVAIVDRARSPRGVALRFITGNADDLAFMFDSASGRVEPIRTAKGRFIVRTAWLVAEPHARILAIERKRPGVPIFQIERFFAAFGRDQLGIEPLKVALNPVPSPSFAREVESLTRIREASITLRRPNHSWTKSAAGFLGDLGASNATEVQIQLNADRNESLSKTGGIVPEIVELSRSSVTALKNATVRGTSPTYEGEKAVSLQRHTVRSTARVDPAASPEEELEQLMPAVEEVLEQAGPGHLQWATDRSTPPSSGQSVRRLVRR